MKKIALIRGEVAQAIAAETQTREAEDARLETAISGATDALATETTNRVQADTVLDNKIGGDLSNLDTNDKTSLIDAINELATNTGKAKILTADDYNYPESNPSKVALWLLDAGVYTSASDVNVALSTGSVVSRGGFYIVGQPVDTSGRRSVFVSEGGDSDNDYLARAVLLSSSGDIVKNKILLGRDDIVNTLTDANVSKVLSASQGKVLKDLIDSLVVSNTGAPTTSTVGTVGQLYEDTTNGELYQCIALDTSVSPTTYTWSKVGGSDINVVQTTGTSTTDVMSQNAVTSMIYADPATKRQVQIGGGASVGSYSMAFGQGALAAGRLSVSFGTLTSDDGVFNIAASGTAYGSTTYRLLTGLYDPQSDHDAATKGYVDTVIAALEARIAALEGN